MCRVVTLLSFDEFEHISSVADSVDVLGFVENAEVFITCLSLTTKTTSCNFTEKLG